MKWNRLNLAAAVLTLVVAGGLLVAGLTGCQTVKGVGEDITNIGEAGEDAINNG